VFTPASEGMTWWQESWTEHQATMGILSFFVSFVHLKKVIDSIPH